ncbi:MULTISPECIES: glycosyltransferase [Methylobacterium]|uniref:glycosyltransferase n=1 Tax=Methylobacterium TaxID=407 RepID=UPI001FAE0968|nr:glycosyltransferase [Methylobacterium sp. Leaf104]
MSASLVLERSVLERVGGPFLEGRAEVPRLSIGHLHRTASDGYAVRRSRDVGEQRGSQRRSDRDRIAARLAERTLCTPERWQPFLKRLDRTALPQRSSRTIKRLIVLFWFLIECLPCSSSLRRPNAADANGDVVGSSLEPSEADRFARVARELTALRQTSDASPRDPFLIAIVVPVYNDWAAFRILARAIDTILVAADLYAELIVVDDGSWQSGESVLAEIAGAARRLRVRPAVLATNLGHQRAIAVGLVQASARANVYRAIVVMDGDGEDQPEHIPLLVAEAMAHPNAVVCAQRRRRFEGSRFALGYGLFKLVFRLCTGRHIDFGHYCAIPPAHLPRLVHTPALWSHFAASLIRSGLPLHRVPLDRGRRYAGRSTMNATALIRHGLNAIAVFEDVCLVRLLVLLAAFGCGVIVAMIGVVAVRFCTDLAMPGWATNAGGLLLVVLFQAALLAATAAAAHLNRRALPEIVPARDAPCFLRAPAAPADDNGEANWPPDRRAAC